MDYVHFVIVVGLTGTYNGGFENVTINILADAFTGTGITISVIKEITLNELGTTISASAYKDATKIKVRPDSTSAYSETTILDLSSTQLTTIENYAFASCSSLTEIKLPSTLTSIGYYAFSGCSNLQKVNIPAKVTTLNNYAFQSCASLTTVNFDETSSLNKLNYHVFEYCTSLASITLPSSIVTLEPCAFYKDSNLTTINLDNITSFGEQCLSGCRLTSISLSSSITTLSNLALHDCLSKDESYSFTITIPSTVTTCGQRVLEGNPRLTTVNWYANLDNIPEKAFYGDKGLTTINLPSNYSSLKTINVQAFYNCSNLTTINNLPLVNTKDSNGKYINNVTKIGNEAFYNCTNLTGNFFIRSDVNMDEDEAFKEIANPKYTINYFNVNE